MDLSKEELKKQINKWMDHGYISPGEFPSIELYMDQVTTFMDKYLDKNKRYEEDKTLTKTMINNYSKNNLLPPSNKKKYNKEHIILLVMIYYFKNMLSINDIHTVLEPLVDDYFDSQKAGKSMEDVYSTLYNLIKHQYVDTEKSVIKAYELSEKNFEKDGDEYIKNLSFVSLLGYDIYMKKRLMESIIDKMNSEKEVEDEKNKKQSASKKQTSTNSKKNEK